MRNFFKDFGFQPFPSNVDVFFDDARNLDMNFISGRDFSKPCLNLILPNGEIA